MMVLANTLIKVPLIESNLLLSTNLRAPAVRAGIGQISRDPYLFIIVVSDDLCLIVKWYGIMRIVSPYSLCTLVLVWTVLFLAVMRYLLYSSQQVSVS